MLPEHTDRPRIRQAILVEGRYDKSTLANAVDANIIELGGFRLFNDTELKPLIRRLAETCGVIILTDSDAAGFKLRNYLRGSVSGDVRHAYIPDVTGKERRKPKPSAEGKLGVEGMDAQTLRRAILAVATPEQSRRVGIWTHAALFELGLSGGEGSANRRRALSVKLGLPARLSTSALVEVLNALSLDEAAVTAAMHELQDQ
ncbi:MAG: DUF4093 domain-containing protein [Oscillospiraceae bacterium]|jgi:ribonuclease M5|nr:DUF4093 domain-containing protein [Oscillospiraceae bacterium]